MSIQAIMAKCQQCGACCEGLILDADWLDALREPKIVDRGKKMDGNGTLDELATGWNLTCGNPCPFLTPLLWVNKAGVCDGQPHRSCSIYRTRPNACLGMIPGGSQCDDCRRRAGLPPLENTEEGKALEKEMED
jgi:Fe-S-cluster containining protein